MIWSEHGVHRFQRLDMKMPHGFRFHEHGEVLGPWTRISTQSDQMDLSNEQGVNWDPTFVTIHPYHIRTAAICLPNLPTTPRRQIALWGVDKSTVLTISQKQPITWKAISHFQLPIIWTPREYFIIFLNGDSTSGAVPTEDQQHDHSTHDLNMCLLNDPAVDPSIQTSSRQENCPLILRIAQTSSGWNKVRHFKRGITHTHFSTSRTTWFFSSLKPVYNCPAL